MKIRSIRHRGLRQFVQHDDPAGLPAVATDKIRKMISFLEAMEDEAELRTIPSWEAHLLTGDQKGVWSLFVTRNWRLTFRVDRDAVEIVDLDYVDYH